ncbi:hypothetical protein Psi02_41950 [Planotetraspora silvatica]|uniref:Uncharacterized protein n=1 Tax=Planotetraspora silvatica TaxID=234614 RepID=A0A8J3UNR6_9ACTN|nr:hypothetical protein [Planotetraspora silvatica]GII47771.1 hypothetical protein Psi02_41950 [Planotetraspora silvatica]
MRDEYLLAALRMAAGADPVPGRVSADARAAFHLRLPEGIVAAPVEISGPRGARSGGGAPGVPEDDGPGVRRFAVAGLTIDVEAVVADGRLEVAGQVSPASGCAFGSGTDAGRDSGPSAWPGTGGGTGTGTGTDTGSGSGSGWQVEIRTSHVSKTRDLSENGRFAVGGLPAGWVSVVCHRPGEPPVSTRWMHVRS